MFFNKPTVKTEARDVLILKFERDKNGDLITADGANVPNEVSVYVGEKTVGRATLHTREDGIHADIMLEKGSMTDMSATAIAFVKTYDRTPEGRTVTQYEITGVGLTKESVTKVSNEDTNTETVQGND